ncbi:hypothetical protein MJO28_004129 [Puccinia striiformis f. sp. tritici]|uniref:Uncharacterized protein n=1 Tax=Puccinia striiformis f. sp. tritici TaxID=168172 RepID=A0ACC0EN29_9BASI|nr:hypothetical protein MJO28_004129 [Puccinia striiformis f. sp. tritici]
MSFFVFVVLSTRAWRDSQPQYTSRFPKPAIDSRHQSLPPPYPMFSPTQLLEPAPSFTTQEE